MKIFWEKKILKKTILSIILAVVALVGLNPSQAYADPPPPDLLFTSTIDDFAFLGPDTQVGAVFKFRNVVVLATFTGGIEGKAAYTAGYSINLVNNHATLSGTIVVVATGGLCVGTLEGHFNGSSTFDPETGDLYPDEGRIFLHGSVGTGCQGVKLEANFIETDPYGIFAVTADIVVTP